MRSKLIRWFFGLFTSGDPTPMVDFFELLHESNNYLRQHRFRVLSTELPDELLRKWLMPNPGDTDAAEYMQNFLLKKDTLHESQLPLFVFDYVLRKQFNRDIAECNEEEMKIAANDLKTYVLLLNYISGMREAGRTPIEFDIFDIGNYEAISRQIEDQKPDKETDIPEKRELSDSEVIAARDAVFGDLMDCYIDEILRILDNYLSMDIGRAEDLVVRVIFRDMAHFDMNPKLSMRDNSKDMFVEKIENRDEDSFSIYLTEANVHLDDLMKRLIKWRKVKRTHISHTIVVKRGENTIAPFMSPTTFVQLRNTVKRYDACERGLREKVGLRNSRERQQEVMEFIDDIKQAANTCETNIIQLINKI